MKKFKLLIMFIVFLYLLLLIGGNLKINSVYEIQSGNYRVEINRLYKKYVENNSMDISNCEYIKGMEFLDYKNKDKNEIENFYKYKNGMHSEIVPVYKDNDILGYLKFEYVINIDNKNVLTTYNTAITFLFMAIIILLIYIERKILKPFNTLSEMPYELSKGNLNDEIEENKNRYFGKFIWGLGMLKDNLESHKKRELKLAKEKKMIILSISHDIKTPLNAINLYAKALEKDMYDDETEKKNAAIKIQEKSKEIDDFVKEIVKSSTEDIISIEVENSEYYLKDLVYKINKGYKEKCELNKIQFNIETYENYLLKGDMDRMYEAIGNLIENAFKYGDGKKIDIKFSEEDSYELISVINSGNPVSENEMPHLFDSFFRGKNSEGKEGNGLGLYICKEIMRKMNGDIFANYKKDGMEFVLVCKIS